MCRLCLLRLCFLRHCFLGLFTTLLLLSNLGCTAKQRFDHSRHRSNYVLTDEELKSLQFYISMDVLLKMDNAPFRLVKGTPGVVTETGPGWLRVSFRKGGQGAYFVADTSNKTGGLYYLAVRNENDSGYQKLNEIRQRTFVREGVKYELIYGTGAYLDVNESQLQNVIDSRSVIEGREVPGN